MNRERAKEFLPVIQAFAEGKEIQFLSQLGNGWVTITSEDLTFNSDENYQYRIKPESKYRPWKPEEVPICFIRIKDENIRQTGYKSLIYTVNHKFIYYGTSKECVSFYQLLIDFEHSLDHGKTWLPCGVLEQE